MADLVVDVEGLARTESQLQAIAQGLGDTKNVIAGIEGDLGSSDVADALHHFERHWSDGRTQIKGSIESVTSMLQAAVEQFRKADTQLAANLTDEG